MSYGIEMIGNDGTSSFLVMDSDLNPDNYQIVATGNASSLNTSTYVGTGGQARVFIKPQSGGPTTADVSGTSYSFYRYNITEDGQTNIIEATRTTISVPFIILGDIKSTAVNTSMGAYGVQVFKANGDVAFDSRRIQANNSFRLLNILGRNTVGGDPQTTGATIAGPSSDVADYYVEASSLFHQTGSTSGNIHGYEILGSGSGQVFRHMFATWNESSGGGGRGGQNITTYANNQFPIIYGELRQ